MFDEDVINDFVNEMNELASPLGTIISKLKINLGQPDQFEEFGQIIDRVYGVVSMFNTPIFSAYTQKMKEVCYKTSRSDSEIAKKKVLELMTSCMGHMTRVGPGIKDKEVLSQLDYKINVDTKRIDNIINKYLGDIESGGVNFESQTKSIIIFNKNSSIELVFKESKKTYFYSPIFTNIEGGFKKELSNEKNDFIGIVICTSCSSNIWLEAVKSAQIIRPGTPILLMSSQKDLESVDIKKLGITDTMPKTDDFGKIVDFLKSVDTKEEEVVEEVVHATTLTNKADSSDTPSENYDNVINITDISEYISVSPSAFTLGTKSLFDVFVKIDDKKFIKIIPKGESFEKEQLEKHLQKGIKNYFITKTDQDHYMKCFNEEIEKIYSDKNCNPSLKSIKFMEFGEEVYSFLEEKGLDEERLNYAKDYVEKSGSIVQEMASNSRIFLDFLMDIESQEHVVSVTLITGLFLIEIGASKKIYQDISMASFLHDIGHFGHPKVFKKELEKEMNEDELKIFHEHPQRGADILRKLNFKPTIVEAVAQHHMRIGGKGFPTFPKGRTYTVNRIAELIGLSEELLKLKKEHQEKKFKMDPIEKMRREIPNLFSPSIQKAFDNVFPPQASK